MILGRGLRNLWLAALALWIGASALPGSAAAGDVDAGASTYGEFCSSCHGRYGEGNGPLAANLQRKPTDFTDSAWLAGRSDEQIVAGLRAASHGSMAIAQLLKPEVLRNTVAYIRRLSVPGKHVSVPQGRDIYNATCWVCHGKNGDGKGPATTNMPDPQPRDFTSPDFVIDGREDEIARIIKLGPAAAFHGSPLMPEWGSKLTDQQIRDVIEYLRTFKTR
jgi:mono/diheme cytochrome c family protein